MSEIAVENINIAEIMSVEGAAEHVERVKAALEADPEMGPMLQGAQSVEDVYEIIKRFSKATFEQAKVILHKVMDYFNPPKAELTDETLDNVVGGWFLTDWWKRSKGGCIALACIITCTAVGAAVGGILGAGAGAVVGTVVGSVAGAIVDAVTKK